MNDLDKSIVEQIEREIGRFEILSEKRDVRLIKAENNKYYLVSFKVNKIVIEDIDWILKCIDKKKKSKYVNKSARKKENLTNGSR